jgi:hypothetical protein
MFRSIRSIFTQLLCATMFILILASLSSAQTFVFRVTDAFLKPDDPRPAAQCPVTVTFHGYVTANGAGVVRYTIAHSSGPGVPHDVGPHELVFRTAGTQRISTTWTSNNLGTSNHYDGWEAIRILSPNPMDSNHSTGGFSVNCQGQLQAANNPQAVTAAPLSGRFAVTLNGFRVNHQTVDDPLERDGAGDEVYLPPLYFVINSTGRVLRQDFGFSGPSRYGQLADWDHNRIQAGTVTPTGGLRSGDSFPAASPETGDGTPAGVGIPRYFNFGEELIERQKALVVIPSVWEWDSSDPHLEDLCLAMARDPHLNSYVSRFINLTPGTGLSDFIKRGSEIGLPLNVSLGHGPLGLGEVGNRPIGMTRSGDRYVFDPQVLILTYDAADMISRTDFGHGPGIFEMRFQDDRDLQGDYTLFLQVRRLR